MFLEDDRPLPALDIEDLSKPPVIDRAAPEQVRSLLSRLTDASNSAGDSTALVEEVRNAAFNMVGFGPMIAAMKGLS